MMVRCIAVVLLGVCTAMAATTAASAAPSQADADRLFNAAQQICDRDGGKLWGRSLCGPVLLVDYHDQSVLANMADAKRALRPTGNWFGGKLPDDVIIANTPTEWLGLRWTQIDAPLPEDPTHLKVLIAHELFHRIQPELGLTRPEAGNRHLDTFDGRYLLQLEWRALAQALRAPSEAARQVALDDALAFRHERYRLFPKAAADEAALEVAEGVPEYTGVMLGLTTQAERVAYAISDLSAFVSAPTFVRSFAYATGPAYGLMLDRYSPDWKGQLNAGRSLDQLLMASLPGGRAGSGTVAERAVRYDDGALRKTEDVREHGRQARLADLRAWLVDGPVLTLPLAHANYQFNPQTLIALDEIGTVYPTMRLVDDWGALTVESGGALIRGGSSIATVSAKGASAATAAGDGWKLELKPGWQIANGIRAGDLVVVRSTVPKGSGRTDGPQPTG